MLHRIRGSVKQYEWGKPGSTSSVAQLWASSGGAVDGDKPYAEFWFGTHTSGPSFVGDQPLQSWLAGHPDALGTHKSTELPYLFKMLSVAKSLSVQAHPDKAFAKVLHVRQPEHYKDDNHKPEMCVALTRFEAMCGFRPLSEIAAHVASVPELRGLVGDEVADAFLASATSSASSDAKAILQPLFAAYMTADSDKLSVATTALERRLREGDAARSVVSGSEMRDCEVLDPNAVALRLCGQYPGDIGIFAPYLLNTVALAPGQALFLAANEPHAYLDGDCMECMACSDNVVRAGLTPKFKDVDALVSMLTYRCGFPEVWSGEAVGTCTRRYAPPVPEFVIERTVLATGQAVSIDAPSSPAIIVLVTGSLSTGDAEFTQGDAMLQGAGTSVSATATSESLFFRVFANETIAE